MSRNRTLFLAGAVLLAFILQIAVMPQFKLFGVQPDLILVVAVVVAVQEGPVQGALAGFCGGMLMDIVSPQVMGVAAFSEAVAAFLAGKLKGLFMTYSILLPTLLVFIVTILELSLNQLTLLMLGQEGLPPFNVIGVVLTSALYNVLAMLVVYPVMRRFSFTQREESIILAKPDGR
jgi:rod shape-determining protein MreD